MKEFEYHIPPEMGNIQSENVPLKNEVNKYPEFNSVSPEYNSFPEQSGTAGSVRRNGNEDQRTEGSGRSSVRAGGEAFRMFGLAVAAVGIVTVSSVLSGGSFFPELGNAATALADMLDRPAVTSQEGIPIPELIAAWNEEQDPEPDDLYIPGTSEPDEEPDGTDDELLTVQSGEKEQSADSNASHTPIMMTGRQGTVSRIHRTVLGRTELRKIRNSQSPMCTAIHGQRLLKPAVKQKAREKVCVRVVKP